METKPLRLCGLGSNPPHETTLETLQVLEECRRVFTDVRSEEVLFWLRGYCRVLVRTDQAGPVLEAAASGGPVGLAVWGHPQFSSRLAREVLRQARARKVPVRLYAAVSPIGSAFARSVSFLGGDYGYQGIQAYDVDSLVADLSVLSPELPLVAYSESTRPSSWERLRAGLAGLYGPGHEATFYATGSTEGLRCTLGGLQAGGVTSGVLLVPPRRG